MFIEILFAFCLSSGLLLFVHANFSQPAKAILMLTIVAVWLLATSGVVPRGTLERIESRLPREHEVDGGVPDECDILCEFPGVF